MKIKPETRYPSIRLVWFGLVLGLRSGCVCVGCVVCYKQYSVSKQMSAPCIQIEHRSNVQSTYAFDIDEWFNGILWLFWL